MLMRSFVKCQEAQSGQLVSFAPPDRLCDHLRQRILQKSFLQRQRKTQENKGGGKWVNSYTKTAVKAQVNRKMPSEMDEAQHCRHHPETNDLVEVVLVLLLLLLGDALDQVGGGVVRWRQLNTLTWLPS